MKWYSQEVGKNPKLPKNEKKDETTKEIANDQICISSASLPAGVLFCSGGHCRGQIF